MDDEHKQTNREKNRAPKRMAIWCPGCDRSLLSFGKKCHVCGVRLKPSREKR
jgi:hypothetical protein